MFRECLRRGLEACGHEVVAEAADGADAVDRAERLRPDVCVLDVSMPVMGGIDATRLLRERALGIPVVVLTMHSEPEAAAAPPEAAPPGRLAKDGGTSEF